MVLVPYAPEHLARIRERNHKAAHLRRLGLDHIFAQRKSITISAVLFGVRVCTICGKSKPTEDFPPRKDRPTPHPHCLQCHRRYWHERKESYRPTIRAYYANNRETINEKSKARYRLDPKKHLAIVAEWGRRNREKLRSYSKKHRVTEKGRVSSARTRRNRSARIRGAYVESVDHALLLMLQDWTCHLCGLKIALGDESLDHLIPIRHGGKHQWGSALMAHKVCNSIKKDRWCDVWIHPALLPDAEFPRPRYTLPAQRPIPGVPRLEPPLIQVPTPSSN